MSVKEGHSEHNFDPSKEDDVKRIKKVIKDLFKKGYYAYSYNKKTGKHQVLNPDKLKDITDEDLTKFVMAKDRKRVIHPPVTSG